MAGMRRFSYLLSSSAKAYIPITALLSLGFAMGIGGSSVLWGVPISQDISTLPIRDFFCWQLLALPPLLLASDHLSNEQAMEVFLRIRLKNDRRRFWTQNAPCAVSSAVWAVLVSLLADILEPMEPTAEAVLITVLGQLMWLWLYLSIYFIIGSVSAALIGTILLMGALFTIGELLPLTWRFLPPAWGMVSRSSLYTPGGIPVAMALGACTGGIVLGIWISISMERIRRAKS